MTQSKRGVSMKEGIMFGLGLFVSVLMTFASYVVYDIRDEVRATRAEVATIRDKYDKKFEEVVKEYALIIEHDKDVDKIEEQIKLINRRLYFRREDDE